MKGFQYKMKGFQLNLKRFQLNIKGFQLKMTGFPTKFQTKRVPFRPCPLDFLTFFALVAKPRAIPKKGYPSALRVFCRCWKKRGCVPYVPPLWPCPDCIRISRVILLTLLHLEMSKNIPKPFKTVHNCQIGSKRKNARFFS